LNGIFYQGSVYVLIDWTLEFDQWLDRLEARAADGDQSASATLMYVLAELDYLQNLEVQPTDDTATLMRVRQSRKYQVWRVSHPFDQNVAIRLICWFPTDSQVIVVLFAGDKARIGDAFYDSVGTRADALIQQWKRQTEGDS
jgi:hypothetical protein